MLVSVVTATYNRASTLSRLFESLQAQKYINFEWIVVDDGSLDETEFLVSEFKKKCRFEIKYYYQENSGKPSAINHSVLKAKGDYIFIVDSDDALTVDAIETINNDVNMLQYENCSFSGLCYRKAYFNGSLLGSKFSEKDENNFFMNATELKNIFNVDLAFCFKRECMLKEPFPIIKNEKFVPELYIWNKITDIEKVAVFINKTLYLCEYLPDGLSANFKSELKKYPKGFFVYYKDQFFREVNLVNKLKMLIRALQCCFYIIMRKSS
ncbi:glycosyltransferase family A protein [Acinetobacter lwoffii]|uniref:glycosyltransferase family A protein n=1 Tax=Acinetobacter lwoffii TaxID=28090 RepID=UPI0032B33333